MPRLFSYSPLKVPPSPLPDNAPPINTVPGALTMTANTTKTFTDASNPVKLGDVDSPTITAILSASVGTIEVIPNPSAIVSNNISSRVIVAGSVVNVNRTLNGMIYTPPAAYNGAVTFTLRTTDGFNIDIDTFTITVGAGSPPPPPPQPPVNVVPGGKTTPSNTPYNFAADGLQVNDPDSTSLTTTLTMTGGTGSVSIGGGAGITGNGTGLITLTGTPAQINAALATLIFTPTNNFAGAGQVSITTSDGTLVDTDTIAVTVLSPATAPVITMGNYIGMCDPATAILFSNGTGREVAVSDPDSSNLTVTLTANHGLWRAVEGTGTTMADGYPPKLIYGFWPGYGSQKLTDVSMNYNVIGLFYMKNTGDGQGNGTVSWAWSGWPSASDVQAVRARGQKVFVVVGGVGYAFFYQTRQQSTNLLNSVIPFIQGLGGLDGIDFNNWYTDITGLDYSTELIYIAQQLKATFGNNFAVTAPPKNEQAYNRNLMKALSDSGCLTWCNPQYTDNVAYKTAGAVASRNSTWISTPLPPAKVLLGFSHNYSYSNSLTLAECTREWDAAVASWTTLRGVGCYNTELDGQVGFAFSNMFKSKFDALMTAGGAAVGNNNSNQVSIYGTVAQCNISLNGLAYTPLMGWAGNDSVTITASDGTLVTTTSFIIPTRSGGLPP